MKKNAFTLVELLAVLVIIGILSAISIAIYTNSIVESRNSLSDFQRKQLVDATRTYVAVNTIDFNNTFNTMTTSECVALSINVLIKEGLIGSNVIDPKDASSLDGYVKVNYSASTSQYEYEYVETQNCRYYYVVENDDVVRKPD